MTQCTPFDTAIAAQRACAPFPFSVSFRRTKALRRLCSTAVSALLAAGLGVTAHAQTDRGESPLSVFAVPALLPAVPLNDANPSGVLSHFDAVSGIQTDVLFGRNTEGPYTLSWQHARLNTETVECDGQALQRDLDYALDYAAGTIRFASSIRAGNTVRVTYSADTPDAIRSVPAVQSIHMDILQKGKNRLRLRTLYREQAASQTPFNPNTTQFGLNALQWTGETPLLRGRSLTSQLDTSLFVDLQGGDWLDRGGFGFGEHTHWGKTDVGLTYQRGGALFTQSDESGIPAGQQTLGATVGVTPAKGVALSGGVQQITPLPASGKADGAAGTTSAPLTPTLQTNAKVTVELPVLARTKVSANIADRYDKDGTHLNREASVQLPRLPLAQTQITGGVQYIGDPGKERTVGLLDATARPLRYLEIGGDARLRDSQTADGKPDPNALDTFGMKLDFAPSKRLHLTGSITRNPEDGSGVKNGQRHALGLTSDWGLFALRGQFGLDEDFTNARFSDSSEFGLDFHLTRYDLFTTGFKGQGLFDRITPGTGTYLFGFTHKLGTTFDLMLNGALTRPVFGGDPSKAEIKTEAKVGLHF